jgi:hypothetical protein
MIQRPRDQPALRGDDRVHHAGDREALLSSSRGQPQHVPDADTEPGCDAPRHHRPRSRQAATPVRPRRRGGTRGRRSARRTLAGRRAAGQPWRRANWPSTTCATPGVASSSERQPCGSRGRREGRRRGRSVRRSRRRPARPAWRRWWRPGSASRPASRRRWRPRSPRSPSWSRSGVERVPPRPRPAGRMRRSAPRASRPPG